MSVYPAPTNQQGSIFNPSLWIVDDITGVSVNYLNAHYLEYPVAQGYETLNGISNLGDTIFSNIPTCLATQPASTNYFGRKPMNAVSILPSIEDLTDLRLIPILLSNSAKYSLRYSINTCASRYFGLNRFATSSLINGKFLFNFTKFASPSGNLVRSCDTCEATAKSNPILLKFSIDSIC